MARRTHLLAAAAAALLAPALGAQGPAAAPAAPAAPTHTDYARAEQLLPWNVNELLVDDAVRPRWMPGDRFWYRNRGARGWEYLVVEMATGARRPAFDHARLASALSVAADTAYDPAKLPFTELVWVDGERGIRFATSRGKHWTCSLVGYEYSCAGPDSIPIEKRSEVRSPDGKWVAFERGGNLWIRDAAGGEARQLTTDGTPDWGYALSNVGCCGQVTSVRNRVEQRPMLMWSPDSRWLLATKWDQRNVRQMHLLETKNPGPVLHSYRYALPGDSVIPRYDLHVLDVAGGSNVRLNWPTQDVVNTTCCWLMSDTLFKDVRWSPTSDAVYFTAGKRGFRQLTLVLADPKNGGTDTLIRETGKTFIETNQFSGRMPNWRPVPGTRDVVWWSERDGWGHLYYRDGATGALRRLTSGDWLVADLVWVDERQRWVYFTAVGRERELDPYFRQYYRVRFDGTAIERLTRDALDHDIVVSPSGRYLVDVQASPDRPPVSVLRRIDGTVIKELQSADASRLLAAGFRAPQPFTVRARDGVTELRGIMWLPANFDEAKKYPVVDYVYPGPQVGSVGSRQYAARPGGSANALAELGFFVVQVDAMGTPGRSKAFHDAYYGNMTDNGIPDQIAAIKQLATRWPQMDLDRVGIYGHSGGGFASTDAILTYPDFFKVAVSSAGNHDNRSYDFTWGEKYQGLLRKLSDSTDSFDSQSNWRKARNLRGRLLLAYGTLDDNVHPVATQLVIDELIKANRDFDLLVMPNRNHGFAGEPYMVRRTWDFFVRHLMGAEPPSGYEIRRPSP